MTASLARFLPDFEFSGIRSVRLDRGEDGSSQPPPEPKIDVEAIRAQARAEGDAMARAELNRRHELDLQALESRHAAELAALRAEMETTAAQAIPAAIDARSADIADLIAGDVEAVLAPLVDGAIRQKILAGLAGEIRAILELDAAHRICVSGPVGLVSALRALVGEDADRLVVREVDGFDIEVEVDRTRFASRLAEWSKTLVESLP